MNQSKFWMWYSCEITELKLFENLFCRNGLGFRLILIAMLGIVVYHVFYCHVSAMCCVPFWADICNIAQVLICSTVSLNRILSGHLL